MPNPAFVICIPMTNEKDTFQSFIGSLTCVSAKALVNARQCRINYTHKHSFAGGKQI